MNHSQRRRWLVALTIVAGVTTGLGAPAALSSYTVADLGSLNGGTSEAFGINQSGEVVGWTTAQTQQQPFVHDGSTMKGLEADPSGYTSPFNVARSVNRAGQAAGTVNPVGRVRAFRYSNGSLAELPPLEGGWSSDGYGINSAGQVVGSSTAKDGLEHSCFWDEQGVRDLGTFGGNVSRAFAVNDSGQVVGIAQTRKGEQRAFLHDGTTMRDLGPGSATSINAAGSVAGSNGVHAFLWEGSVRKDLGTLGGSTSYALGLNDVGQVVGSSDTARNERHAFLYEAGRMWDLNDILPPGSGCILEEAAAINNAGQIVGRAVIQSTTRAFRMTPRQGGSVVELSPPYPPPTPPIDIDLDKYCAEHPGDYVCSGGSGGGSGASVSCFVDVLSGCRWGRSR